MGGSAFSKLVDESSSTHRPRTSSFCENNRKMHDLTVASGSEEDTVSATTVIGNKKNDQDRSSPTSVLGLTPETPRNHHQPNNAVVQTNNKSLDEESPMLVLSSSSPSAEHQQQHHSPAPMTGKLQDATERDVAVVQAIRKDKSLDDIVKHSDEIVVVSPRLSTSESPPMSNKTVQPPVTVEKGGGANDKMDTTGLLEAELAEKKKEVQNLRQFMEKTFKKHHAETLAWKAEKEQLIKKGDEATAKQVAMVEEGYEKTFALEEQDLAAMKQSLETVQREKKDLEAAVETAVAQRAKTLTNLKKKRELLAQSEAKRTAIQAKLDEATKAKAHLDQENASLRAGLSKVTSVRDEVKMKLRTKNELIREARQEVEVLEKKMSKTERERSMERELLEHYRKLARHTGYFKWGKPIRQLESTLAESNNNNNDA